MHEVIFLEPVFKEMIWGGSRLADDFGYDIPGKHTGECWAVSAHKNGDCQIRGGSFGGKHLSELWREHRELFGGATVAAEEDMFPLLVKIIDAKEDLSIQVHPDNTYAKEHENGSLGKTECWYILDCDKDAKIVIGHHAKSKEELKQMIKQGRFDDLIRVIPVKKGDFFQIVPGTVHAIKGGTLILETQQNSDITYRLYDYGRLADGKPRKLHLEKSIDVINCPHQDTGTARVTEEFAGGIKEHLVSCDYYSVDRLSISGDADFTMTDAFRIFSVVEGAGMIDGTDIKKGDHFLLPAGYGKYRLSGEMELITSCTGKKKDPE
ncbi:MAG: mannose-6-phosphate isomerase, class I [Lachnospiraceae bacterium]|nr:mannose-6-phosphate isomerase, class I [Lachnospiraceae bacterium]